ncbi:hypothetical protein JMI38_003892 [Salmonella enterica]|nr:hypothetical protein [Salmonella enterica]EEE0150213.1 hypothetical protein [Salmonella enterica]EEE0676201.1 hypothetical protein [Salmonella enterica]EEP7800648.1 hypothetical protein [Salmonella enterica]EFP3722725.1 hypothetical protein [Salmonella enterica]
MSDGASSLSLSPLLKEFSVPPGPACQATTAKKVEDALAEYRHRETKVGQNGIEEDESRAEQKHVRGWPLKPERENEPCQRRNTKNVNRGGGIPPRVIITGHDVASA